MGAIYNSIPEWVAGRLQRELCLKVFVETGLGQGTSALWAEQHFSTIISIEIDQTLIDQFERNYTKSRVVLIKGDSGVELAKLMPDIALPALFWLDGHTDDYTPVMAEIAAINTSKLDHIIMVDDLRYCGLLPTWPSNEQLHEIASHSGRRTIWEFDDVLIAAPKSLTRRVGRYLAKR